MTRLQASILLAAILSCTPASHAQQATLNHSIGLTNAYVWRGVTMADQPSLQGDLSISLPAGGTTLTAGGWTNWEVDPDGGRFSSLTEYNGGVGELDLYAQAARSFGGVNAAIGITALRFPQVEEWNTLELYGSVALPGAPLAPGLVVRKDVDAVGGAYAELSLTQGLSLAGRTLALTGVAGASTGQDDDGDLAWYASEGLTHLALTASSGFSLGEFTVTPALSVIHGLDEFTEVNGDATRLGASLTLSSSFGLPR